MTPSFRLWRSRHRRLIVICDPAGRLGCKAFGVMDTTAGETGRMRIYCAWPFIVTHETRR